MANDVDVQQIDAETVFGEVVEYAFCLLLQRNVLDDYEIASAECHDGQAQAVADGANRERGEVMQCKRCGNEAYYCGNVPRIESPHVHIFAQIVAHYCCPQVAPKVIHYTILVVNQRANVFVDMRKVGDSERECPHQQRELEFALRGVLQPCGTYGREQIDAENGVDKPVDALLGCERNEHHVREESLPCERGGEFVDKERHQRPNHHRQHHAVEALFQEGDGWFGLIEHRAPEIMKNKIDAPAMV